MVSWYLDATGLYALAAELPPQMAACIENRITEVTTMAASVRTRCRVLVVFGALWFALSLRPPALAQVASPRTDTTDREQLSAIVAGMEKAWNEHDMRALADLFHEDGIWVLWTGEVWKGRSTIEAGHAAVHKTVFRNSTQRKRIEEATFIGEDTAVLRTYDTLTGDERSPDKVVRSRKLLIVTRRGGNWKVAWGQNTRLLDSTRD
jgi:uncharacterized protein (TIGR02246 family)